MHVHRPQTLGAIALAFVCLATAVPAQEAAPPAAEGPADPGATAAAEQPADPVQATYVASGWALNCTSRQADALDCAVSQSVSDRATGGEILSIAIAPGAGEAPPVMRLRAAHGFLLDRGILMQVDDGDALRIPFRISDPQGIGTAAPVGEDVIELLVAGERVILAPTGPRGRLLELPLDLGTFADLYAEAAELAGG